MQIKNAEYFSLTMRNGLALLRFAMPNNEKGQRKAGPGKIDVMNLAAISRFRFFAAAQCQATQPGAQQAQQAQTCNVQGGH